MELQGSLLRRLLTGVNRICGRPYRPRDPVIRRICSYAGATWPDPTPKSGCQEEDDEEEEEESESEEEFSDDEEVDVPLPSEGALHTWIPRSLFQSLLVKS